MYTILVINICGFDNVIVPINYETGISKEKTYNKILNLVKKYNLFVYSGRLSPNRFMVLCACKVRGKHDQSCCVSHQ